MIKKSPKLIMSFILLFVLLLTTTSAHAYFDVDDGISNSSRTGTCPLVQNTPFFTIVYGTVTSNGESAPVGSVVKAYSPRDELVGCFEVTSTGNYGAMYIYGEDTSVSPSIPGMRTNESVTFTVNDVSAVSTPTLLWANDKDLHQVNLASDGIAANFTATPLSGISPLVVQFSDTSTGDITSWSWDFGDGSTSTASSPQHTYNSPGSFTVSLTVSGSLGSDTETKSNYISAYSTVIADFASDRTNGIAPFTVNFTNTSTGDYSSLLWDFGDGATSTLTNPSHSYSTGGVYTVSLTATGPGGTDTETKTGYITVFSPVTANFTGSPTSGVAPLNVAFSDTSTGDYSSLAWEFGDGGSSIEQNPNYQYTTPGVYSVTLTVSGNGGTDSEIKTDYITVYAPVTADFTGTPTSGVAPLEVTFTEASTGDYVTYGWDFGDGSTSTLANPSHEYTTPGVYTVSLTVSGDGGSDEEVKTDYITVYAPVTADFTGGPTSGVAPLDVSFTDASTGDYDTYAWAFGDGNASTLANPTHQYLTSGVYNVTLTVSGDGGTDAETKIDYITVYTPADADFTYTPSSGLAPLEVTFTDTSTGDYDTYAWSYGDGETSTLANPVHTYSDPGTYTISLTVSGNGGESTETKSDIISVYGAAMANFTSDVTNGIAPLTVTFTDTSTGTISSWAWDFGDGNTSALANPIHEYTTPGIYTVALTVSGDGGTDSEIKTDYITVYASVRADFTGTPTSGVAPLEVTFTNTSTGDYDTYSWDFGDSGTSTLANPTHEYTTPGVYTVTLTVSGDGGTDEEIKTDYITVYTPADADFTYSPSSGLAPLEVTFTDTSTGVYETYAWSFGDGETSTLENPVHTYADPGTYTVSLTVSGNGGDSTETKADIIGVYGAVVANFSSDETQGIAPLTVNFTDTSTGTISSWSWDFGDGSTSTLANPIHEYTIPGVYTVTLTVSGDGGTDSEIKTDLIMVYEPVVADFILTPSTGTAPLLVNFTNLSSGDYETLSWDFGDGSPLSSENNPSHIYTNPGTYTITLIASGPGGEDTAQADLIVKEETIFNHIYLPLIIH